jgi:Nif-specific regulatory protein
LRSKFHRVLTILELHSEVIRSHIVLLRDETSDLCVEASKGLTNEGQEAVFRLGEGVTGRVVESAKAIVVPQLDREPLFLNRTGPRPVHSCADLTFISVPILIDGEPVGALSVDLPFREDRDYEESVVLSGLHASMIARAIAADRLAARSERPSNAILALKPDDYDFSNVVGNSGPMQQVYLQVSKVARTNATVMIRGESGTGKELIAHALHYNSKRKSRPFIKVNCAALPDALIESELFGHEKGAFTGAVAQKKGRFELAEGGTLFLDEIGELSASTSTKPLRVLQEREYERLGGTQTIKADVRLIVATNRDLEKALAAGTFREDLYYRLNVFSIFLPPLRERKPDVLLLTDHFLEEFNREHGKQVKRVSTPAIDMLMSYHWPGNVRELRNTIERAMLVSDGHVIHAHHLPPTLQTAESSGTVVNVSLKDAVETYEKDLIQDTLKTTRGNRGKAAKLLQTTERIINYKTRKYGIDAARFRN